ncbi:hypothetical protein KIN20_001838 [Parelaphostrongylus tenuis]|uniref:Cytochrome P450 n=1 Tax=Parelaphostrongylus tenuis TaxID=148309 RepID=A0AAD5MDC9_PARTN|nr:hypothetical protein KIN20_001838 [Parelaphostrongylus tenuis]
MHEESDREVGSGRLITMSDQNNLPYTCAVINRLANLLPLNMLRETLSSSSEKVESVSAYRSYRPSAEWIALNRCRDPYYDMTSSREDLLPNEKFLNVDGMAIVFANVDEKMVC